MITFKKEASGTKRTHALESSNSDKEISVNVKENPMTIVSSTPNSIGWWKVEKKEGRKE